MKLLIHTLQSYVELSEGEIRAICSKDIKSFGPLVELTTKGKVNCSRLAQSRNCSEIIVSGNISEFSKKIKRIDWKGWIKFPYAIRNVCLDFKHDLNKELGNLADLIEPIKGSKVDLNNPKTNIMIYRYKNKFWVTRLIWKPETNRFKDREPQKRPGFHPSTLRPQLALTLVNLSGIKSNQKVLDPFCGTGAILVEAGLLGAKVNGIDLDSRMVEKCKKNFKHYKISGKVQKGDATELKKLFKKESFDAIVCDPPYGKISTLAGRDRLQLYSDFLKSAYPLLKKGKKLIFLHPTITKLPKNKFKKQKSFEVYVHGGLTRKIEVLVK